MNEAFEKWWKDLFEKDAEYLEDFTPDYAGFKEIAETAFKAGIKHGFQEGIEAVRKR